MIEPSRIRRGDAYATLTESPELVEALQTDEISQKVAAQAIGVSESMFSEAWATYLFEHSLAEQATTWEMEDQARWHLALEGEPPLDDPDAFEDWLDNAVEGFVAWRAANFVAPNGEPYITKDFHKEWIKETLRAIITGSRHMILSPPRHGKSELLIHFIVWCIARDPHFRAIWIGPNQDIAGDMVLMVRKHLEQNEGLRAATLPPGVHWQPAGRTRTTWGSTKFTVANRNYVLKSPTLRAVGRGQKILSMDVDLIVCDDIEDFDSTLNEKSRTDTRHWMFNNVESRKEEHTAWLTIGSRQHPDDVYDYILGDDQWSTQVDSAHDPECAKDTEDYEAHQECMLFPELRTYRWLMGKKMSAANQGLLANYEMVYLNDPRPAGMVVFRQEAIDSAKNHSRGLGLEGMRKDVRDRLELDPGELVSYHLVAGLDPSATGFQAGFLWAWVPDVSRLYAIDISNRKGGGIYQALELFVEWHERYELKHWVWENNIMREADLLQNPDVRKFVDDTGVYLEPHNTQGGNKNDPMFGVGAQAGWYDDGLVDLPWGTEDARSKFVIYERQMIRFVDQAGTMRRTNRKSDVLMASWFPMKAIRRFQKEVSATVYIEDDGFEMTGWDDILADEMDDVPW